jgi:hypothetical protein
MVATEIGQILAIQGREFVETMTRYRVILIRHCLSKAPFLDEFTMNCSAEKYSYSEISDCLLRVSPAFFEMNHPVSNAIHRQQ